MLNTPKPTLPAVGNSCFSVRWDIYVRSSSVLCLYMFFFFVLFLDDHCFREEYVEYELVRVTISLGLYINTVDCWFGKSNKMLMCSKSDGSGRS